MLNKNNNRNKTMSFRQEAEKQKGNKQSMRKAALTGLASLGKTTGLGGGKMDKE